MTRVRVSLAAAIGADLLGAMGVLFFAGRGWQRATVSRARPLPDAVVNLSGRDLHAATTAFALIALAGVVAVAATRGWARRIVGLVLIAAGAVVGWYAVAGLSAVSAGQARTSVDQRGRRRPASAVRVVVARELAGADRGVRRADRAGRDHDGGQRRGGGRRWPDATRPRPKRPGPSA